MCGLLALVRYAPCVRCSWSVACSWCHCLPFVRCVRLTGLACAVGVRSFVCCFARTDEYLQEGSAGETLFLVFLLSPVAFRKNSLILVCKSLHIQLGLWRWFCFAESFGGMVNRRATKRFIS